MVDDNELERLSGLAAPAPSAEAKARALAAAMQAFDEKNSSRCPPRIGGPASSHSAGTKTLE